MPTRCPQCGGTDYSDQGDIPCECAFLEQQQPEPEYPIELECEGRTGHAYHGDDEHGGRCYCGERRYPAGGPKAEVSS